MQDNKILWVVITVVLVAVFAYSLFFNSPSYTVTFDSSGGTEIAEQTVRRNGSIETVETPFRTGYTFVSWTYHDETVDLSEKSVTGNMALVATWEAITFTITFDSAQGTEVEPITVVYGSEAQRPENPTRERRRFHYWALDGERFDFETPIHENLELVAVWRR